MTSSFWEIYRDDETRAGAPAHPHPCRFYGFEPEDVAEIHRHRNGVGKGLWFRLKDGRVIDKYGVPADSDRRLYG